MRKLILLIAIIILSVNSFGHESRIPLIRPLFSFETGIVGHSMSNMSGELEKYTGVPQALNASFMQGINAGIFIGQRHKLAFIYNANLITRHEGYVEKDVYSTGFWYQYKLLKHRCLYVQFGFSETISNLYISDRNSNPAVSNGTLSEYLSNNTNFTIAHFERWTNGINFSVLYSFISSPSFQLNGQLGYLLNFDKKNEHWQYMPNNGERNNDTRLPKDNLNGLFLKFVLEFDYISWRKSE